jgi:tRNA-2-methylthio-N6-dimethylallyladenosine synthase
MNYSDSQRIDQILSNAQYTKVDKPEKAGVLLINTCAVRQRAEDKVIGWVNNQLAKDSSKKIALTGCMLRRDYSSEDREKTTKNFEDIKKKIHGTLIGFDIRDIEKLPQYLQSSDSTYKYSKSKSDKYLETNPVFPEQGITAYIPIMTGCNEFCSYCTVPFSRGEEINRPTNDILREVSCALNQGKTHIFLLGQIVDKWEYGGNDFLHLLKELCTLKGIFWVSFLSPHPKYITKDLLDFIIKEPKMMKFLSLPLQSGSNKILQLMNRKYTTDEYLDKVRYFKGQYKSYLLKNKDQNLPPEPYITTDVIVGFPKETKSDFNQTKQILKEVEFNQVYTAYYSQRPFSTAAKSLNDNISHKVKKKRKKEILKITNQISAEKNKNYVGEIINCMPKNTETGFTYANQFIEFENSLQNINPGTVVPVKVTDGGKLGIKGEISAHSEV